jgi:glycosyltransferase involved in cell wall biosynthesis
MPEIPAGRAALIIPALNEEGSLPAMLAGVPRGLYRAVIVADNGSTDLTADVARRAGATVVHEQERGYGAACLRAIGHVPEDVEAVVFMQADASEDAAEAPLLLAPILEGRADLVVGSRRGAALRPHQRLGNALSLFLIRVLFGHRYTDLGPYRAIRMSSLRELDMRDRNYGWTAEMQIKALQRGLRVLEAPVSTRPRLGGRDKVSGSLKGSLLAGGKILWTILRLAARRRQ